MENEQSILGDLKTPEVEASYSHRFLSNLLDFAIEVLLIMATYKMIPSEWVSYIVSTFTYTSYAFIVAWIFLYRFLCIFLFNKTIAMMICKIKYLNDSLVPLNTSEKLLAVFAIGISKIKYYKVGK